MLKWKYKYFASNLLDNNIILDMVNASLLALLKSLRTDQ